jgi:ribosomal protein L44E
MKPCLKKTHHQKGKVEQGVGPEVKPQYQKKNRPIKKGNLKLFVYMISNL